MAAHKGSALKIKQNNVVICSGINQKDINFNAALIDVSEGSNRGHRVLLTVTDSKSLDISFKGVAKDRFLRKLRLTDNNFLENITLEFGNGDTITGNFMMNSYTESGGFKDAVQFSCDFQSTSTYLHTFSASENDDGSPGGGSSEITGAFNILGRFDSNGGFEVEQGMLPAVAPHFDIESGLVDHIYQRYRVTVDSDEVTDLVTCAIMGSYAINCELINFGTGQRIFITGYRTDSGILTDSSWSSTTVSPDPIDIHYRYKVNDVIVCGQNKFGVVAQLLDGELSSVNYFEIVEFSSPSDHTVHTITFNLSDLGFPGIGLDTVVPRVAANIDANEICAIYSGHEYDVEGEDMWVMVVFDTETYTVKSCDAFDKATYGDPSPLAGLTAVSENCLELSSSSFYYKTSIFSCSGFMNTDSFNSYGQYVEYQEYSERTIDTDYVAQFADLSDQISIDMPALVGDKLIAIGFTPLDYGVTPKFGGVGVYIS